MRPTLRIGVLLLLVALLVGSASAEIIQNPVPVAEAREEFYVEATEEVAFDVSSEGLAIADVFFFSVPPDSHIDFTLYHGGSSTTGSVDYARNGWGYNKTFTLGGETSSYEGWMPPLGAGFCVYYGKDANTSESYLSIGDMPPFGEDERLWVAVPGLHYAAVHKVSVQASQPIDVRIHYGDRQAIQECLRVFAGGAYDWVAELKNLATSLGGLIYGVIVLFKLLLIDRWLQILVVFESVAIGHSCYNARDFIGFIRNFTRANEKAITLVAHVIAWIMEFFFKLLQSIKP